MQTPDLCTALIDMIEKAYEEGHHINHEGKVDQTWLYACIAMAGIGHSKQPRFVQFAAAAINEMDATGRTTLTETYLLPPLVSHTLLSGTPAWPPKPTPPSIAAPMPYVAPAPAADFAGEE